VRASSRFLWAILLVATGVRLVCGWRCFGFHTGDDLEILQAAFLRALGWPYPPWEIRNLLVSDLLAAPVIAAAAALGVRSTQTLAWIATWPFVALASLNVWLVHRLALRWLGDGRPALLAAGLYAFHWMPLGYGSTVYPRTASTACILLAVLLLREARRAAWPPLAAGGLLAVAFGIRYSEGFFLLPLLALAWWRPEEEDRRERLRCTGLLLAGFLAGICLTVGVEDQLTWGRPFASLVAFVRYTVVEHGSSSMFRERPWYWYPWQLHKWVPLTLLPFLWRARRVRGALPFALCAALPLLLLSAIHQKQLRYLQGVLPFVILLAAAGAWSLWADVPDPARRRMVGALVALSLLVGLKGIEFLGEKSMAAVEAAQELAALRPAPRGEVCLSQAWAYGGTLYLGTAVRLRDLPVPLPPDALAAALPRCSWVLVYDGDLRRDPRLGALLAQQGYAPAGVHHRGWSKAVAVFRRLRAG